MGNIASFKTVWKGDALPLYSKMDTSTILTSIQSFFASTVAPPLNSFLKLIPIDPQLTLIGISIIIGMWLKSKIESPLHLILICAFLVWFALKFMGLGA